MSRFKWTIKARSRIMAILAAFAIVLGTATAITVTSAGPAHAACAGTHCDAQGTLLLAGKDWLNGNGVDVRANNGSASYDSGVNDYVTVGTTQVLAGEEWQCVELINRLYLTRGWTTTTWSGNGNQLYANAPAGLTKEANGSITYLAPGDVVSLDDGGFGHAGIVNTVSGSAVTLVNQNTQAVSSAGTFANGSLTINGGWSPKYWVVGVIHAPNGSGSSPIASLANGTYIQATDTGKVYVMAGGSPMAVSGWAAVGGTHTISDTYPTQSQITSQGLMYPRDGTVVRDAVTGALFVVGGGFPFGVTATSAVPTSYADPAVYVNVDGTAITHLRSQPADGTAIRDFSNGNPYVISGDAPVYVHDPTTVPYTNWIDVDHWDLANELQTYPADGSVLIDTNNAVYVMAGAAPMGVMSLDTIPPITSVAYVDVWAIHNKFPAFPRNGTMVRNYVTKNIYVVAGGSLTQVNSLSNVPPASYVNISDWSIANQFLPYPEDGTYISDYSTSIVYVIAGGSAMKVTSWDNVGGSHPTTAIDHNAFQAFRQYPADGTVLRDYVHGTMYVIAGGSPLYITGPPSVPAADMTSYVNVDPNSFSQLIGYPLNGTFVVGYVSQRVYQIQNQAAVYIGNSSLITSPPTPVDDWSITNQLHGS